MNTKILCLGDPVSRGARATRGYPENLWEVLRAGGLPVLVHNAGLERGTLSDVLRATPAAIEAFPADVVVLLAPVYDSKGGGTAPGAYRSMLEQTVELARCLLQERRGEPPIVLLGGPTPVGEKANVQGFARPARRWIPKAAEAASRVAQMQDVLFVPLHEMDPALLADSIHPKPDGYRWIAERVAAALAPVLPRPG